MDRIIDSTSKPDHSPDQVYPVHLIDQAAVIRSSIINYVFRYDCVLDADKLHRALSQLIEVGEWRKLGGRLRRNRNGLLEIHVPQHFTTARPPIRFSHVDFPFDIDSHPKATKLPRETGSRPSIHDGCPSFRSFALPPTLPNHIDHYLTTDEPLLCLHITSFADSTLVALNFPHSIADAMGTADILKAWSSMLRGGPVKHVLGTQYDVLASTGIKMDHPATEKFVHEDEQARGLGLLAFVVRHAWDQFTQTSIRARHIYLPAGAVARLREQAEADLRLASGSGEIPFLSDGDIITAWGARMVLATTNSSAAIYNVFDLRSRLRSAFDRDAVYLQNAILPSVSILSAQETHKPVGQIALRVRQSIVEQTSETQIRRLMRIAREWFTTIGSMPLFAKWDTRIVACTNWTRAGFFEAPDFQAAVTEQNGDGLTKGKPSMVMGTTIGIDDNPRDTYIIYGKDAGGNYWLHAYLREETWRTVEFELENLSKPLV